jgi:hypothetical protein
MMDQSKEKETVQLGLDVLSRLGTALKNMTEDIERAEQPRRIRCLLVELAKLDARGKEDDPPSR